MHVCLMVYDSTECLNLQAVIKSYGSILAILFFAITLQAQDLPKCNMYLFTMTKGGGKITLKSPKFLTAFNSNGYNNQPSFIDENQILFTTNYYSLDQTEIARFDLFEESLTRVTYTDESEYSPAQVPDKTDISCVRVEADGKTQSLSTYPQDGIGYAKRYLNNTSNVGYYNWMDAKTVALFLVEAPNHNLAIADPKSERRKIILDKIGRTLKKSKDGNLIFIHKQTEDEWYIKSYDLNTNRSKTLITAIRGEEDFELLNDDTILMGSGAVLYRFDPKKSTKSWEKIIDLSSYGIKDISRITSKKNKLVIVSTD